MGLQEPAVVFSNLPTIGELKYVIVSTDPKERRETFVESGSQWQLLKTRLLIYSSSNVIASPYACETKFINVVCTKEFYKSGCLQLLLQEHQLRVEASGDVNMKVYEECLLHHIVCRISPKWNKIENYFIQDKFFLIINNPLDAVQIHMGVSGDQLLFYCKAKRLWLSPFKLEDIILDDILLPAEDGPQYSVRLSKPVWVQVLPSFKSGKAVSVSNYLPESSPFKSYDEVRRHWKNTYGFRLPNNGVNMIYVEVNFFGSENFTYPLPCLRKGIHEDAGNPDLITDLAAHFLSTATNICGQELNFAGITKFNSSPEKDLRELQRKLMLEDFNPEMFSEASKKRLEIGRKSVSSPAEANVEWFRNYSSHSAEVPSDKYCKISTHPKNCFCLNNYPRRLHSVVIRRPIFIEEPFEISRLLKEKENQPITPLKSETSSKNSLLSTEDVGTGAPLSNGVPPSVDNKSYGTPEKHVKAHLKSLTKDKNMNILSPQLIRKKTKNTVTYSDEDILDLAKNKQLHKVNIPTLINFLRKCGIKCRQRDKKPSLLEKAECFLHEKGVIPTNESCYSPRYKL